MYKLKLHKGLASRWCTFSQSQQVLMIANELNRVKNFMKKEDHAEIKNAYERAFELLDLTISAARTRFMRYELLRFRELVGREYVCEKKDVETVDKLMKVLVALDKDSYKSLSL